MKEEMQTSKRLLCIVGSMNLGGAETFLMKMYRFFDIDKHQMDFIVNKKGIYDEEIEEKGGKIYYIPLRTKHPFKSFYSIIQIVRENGYKCVLKPCNTAIGFFDIFAAKLGGANRIIVRSCNSNSDMGTIGKIVRFIFQPFFNKIATVKLAPSTEAGKYTFGKKVLSDKAFSILNNGLDTTVFSYNENNRRLIRKELCVEEDEILLVNIGRFTRQKNHEFLLDIFEEISKKNCGNIKLVLVGEGELKSSIEKQATSAGLSDKIMFLGNRIDVPNLLSAMDLLIMPSFYEGMPNVVIEAQANGLPCIISDTITPEAKITDLVHYCNLDLGAKEWAERVIELVDEKTDYRLKYSNIMKKNGYEVDDVVKKFVKLTFGE